MTFEQWITGQRERGQVPFGTAYELFSRKAFDAGVAAERERCAKPVPDEWLVKVRRLVQGFEHVSGIARLWEPDYSSGSDRALWSRATEACADVAKLLREADGPNARLTAPDTAL